MLALSIFVLALLPSWSSAVSKDRLEQIRLLHGHDGIDTATVHISYPHSPGLRRLTKREAVENLVPHQHDNFTVKVTLKSSGHVLDLQLQRSKLQMQGALVTVMKEGGGEEKYQVQDEKCHYQGFFDDSNGMASVHFCDGVLVGGAHNGQVEYNFHSHLHPLPDDPKDGGTSTSSSSSSSSSPEDVHKDPDLTGDDLQESYHTIVSWKDVPQDFPPGDTLRVEEEEKEKEEEEEEVELRTMRQRRRRQADSSLDLEKREGPTDPKGPLNPVVEFGVIFDEDFLRDHHYLYPTRRDLINFLMFKYTGVQALYGNPGVTGFNLTVQIKLIYLWYKNPSWYEGSTLKIGRRMGAGKNFSHENADYATTDVGALYTSQAPGIVEGMAAGGGACLVNGKTFVTRGYGLNWITECHELGHTLGLLHNPVACRTLQSPNNAAFMNSYVSKFLPCYKTTLEETLQRDNKRCLFRKDVNTTNIPPFRFASTFPILEFGYNYHCRSYLREDAEFVAVDKKPCGAVLCAVMNQSSGNFGQAQLTRENDGSLFGRSCGPNGMICLNHACKTPQGNTTVTAIDTVTGTGTWGRWSCYEKSCTSSCGYGVQISSRTCSNKDRAEACLGPRFRAKLCNTHTCPGDHLKQELELRQDRADYTCSLFKARGGPLSQYIAPSNRNINPRDLISRISVESCLAWCNTESTNGSLPRLQMRQFGRMIIADGTLCGPLNLFDRHVLDVTTRCLRGQCIEFGCDDFSMEERHGKVKDLCGVCGGDNSTCNSGQTTVRLANATNGATEMVVELPAGTKDIMFAIRPESYAGQNRIKLALMDKDDSAVIVPGLQGQFQITNTGKNPLSFAGTHWTTVENEILSAPGPLDQPVKIKVKNMQTSSTPLEAVVVWRYELPSTVPSPPTCQNNGVANVTNGGCMCLQKDTHGKHCEFHCHDLCLNGGQKLQDQCRCDCSNNPRTTGARCECRQGFAGPDCSRCALHHCYHGGVLNTTTCTCQCPRGCEGKPDCSDCNFSLVLPTYKGHYGRGSLEDSLLSSHGLCRCRQ